MPSLNAAAAVSTVHSLAPLEAPGVMPAFQVPGFDWKTLVPLVWLGGSVAGDWANNQWMSLMTSMWAGALWMTQFAFKLVDAFTTPDLTEGGPMGAIYPATFAIGGALALILGFVQIGVGAWQRDGRGLARVLVGVPQFGLAWAGMLGVGAMLTVATSGLTQGLLQLTFGTTSFGNLNVLRPWQPRDAVDASVATVLGVCGILLIFAAIGYLLIMLVRAGALVVLMATSPISAAGLLTEGTRAWFWKSLRWFMAALMIAPLAALVLGVGKKLTDGVMSGAGDSTQAAVGQGVLGTVLIVIGGFAPLILFRLLAFVDPGTSSGQSFRASLDAAGGLGGLLGGRDGQGEDTAAGSGAATAQAGDGGSQGEADAATAAQGRLSSAMGAFGGAARGLSSFGQATAGFGADVLSAAGVGHQQPYVGSAPASNRSSQNPQNSNSPRSSDPAGQPGQSADGTPSDGQTGDSAGGPASAQSPAMPPPQPPSPPAPPSGSGSSAGPDGHGQVGPGGGKGGKPPVGSTPASGGAGGAAGGVEGAAAVAAL